MSIILAIETSTEVASAALLRADKVVARATHGVQTHSETILPMIQALLVQADICLAQCDAIAFGVGPGSFTGVRTACGIVQGLAFGANVPVVPIVTLEAMAQACRDVAMQEQHDVLAVLDARMGEVYWAQYRLHATGWQVVTEPTLSAATDIVAQGTVLLCGNGVAAYPDAFVGQPWVASVIADITPHATAIAELAVHAVLAGNTLPAEEAQPLYLRNKVALTTAERMVRDAAKVAAQGAV